MQTRSARSDPIPNPKSRIPPELVSHLHRQRGLSGSQPRDRYAIRRHGHVIQPDLLEEVNRRGIAAMLAADAELDVGTRGTPLLDGDADERADADGVDGAERILVEDLLVLIRAQELAD